jgi:hypothetical protein
VYKACDIVLGQLVAAPKLVINVLAYNADVCEHFLRVARIVSMLRQDNSIVVFRMRMRVIL